MWSRDVIDHMTIRLAVVDFLWVVHCDHASIWHRYGDITPHSTCTPVFFNFFAAAEPYISVKITYGTPWHAMIRESNGVGKVEFSGCLRTDVPSRVEKQKTCGNLRKNPKRLKR